MKHLLFLSMLGLAACSWQTAAIVVPTVAAVIIGPKIATDYYYAGHNKNLRQLCAQTNTQTDCDAYAAAVRACYAHLGWIATDASKKNCEG